MKLLFGLFGSTLIFAQDPFTVAPTHYQREFENAWVQVARVSYKAHDKAPLHDHPALPTVYIYITDGGPMRFFHDKIGILTRPAVKGGGIRIAPPAKERHSVEYLGQNPTEYLRIQLKTEPLEVPKSAIHLRAEPFENAQLRIVRLSCPAACPPTQHPENPAVAVSFGSREVRWLDANAPFPWNAPGEYVRLELKSKPSL